MLSLFLLLFLGCTTLPVSEINSDGPPMPVEGESAEEGPKTPQKDPPLEGKAVPPALSAELLVQSAVSLLDEDHGPVIHQNTPWGLIHDLDKNGYADFLLLTLQNGNGAPVLSEDLMDPRRLFEDPPPHENFRVVIFYQHPNRVRKQYTIPLKNKLILQNFRFQEIHRGRDFPYTLSVSFRSTEGIEEEWISLHGRGISRFTVKQSLLQTSLVEDIDEDGYTDVVVHQRGFEDGSGHETFITWYRWNGRKFEVHETTNVVRNLKLFFAHTQKAILAEGWQDSFINRLEPQALEEFRSQGLGDGAVLSRFFYSPGGAGKFSEFAGD